MGETQTEGRQVRHVFAAYRRTAEGPTGDPVVGLAHKSRGETITDFAAGEEERLDRLGALMPKGGEVEPDRIEDALARALNPLDVTREDYGAPVTVAAPSMGAAPRGDFTKGDTGVDPADQPPPLLTGTVTTSMVDEGAAISTETSDKTAGAPPVEDTEALADFIREERPNASETVALAEGDPERASQVLEAEKVATGQDPRKSVADPLQKIIDEGNAGE